MAQAASTLSIAPADISLTDFGGGFQPDLVPSAVPPNGLLDVNNLLPDRETGALETRKGYQRFSNLLVAGFEVRALWPFLRYSGAESEPTKVRLVAVLRKTPKPSPREVDDVQIWSIDVTNSTAARIDHAGVRTWKAWECNHWGAVVDNVYYGGGELDPMYSYRPYFIDGSVNPEPYDPDATMGQFCTTQWATGQSYVIGDRRWDTVAEEKLAGGLRERKYVFVCTTAHTSAAWNRPGSEIVTNDDGEVSSTQIRVAGERRWEKLGRYIPEWASGTTYKVGAKVSYLITGNTDYPRGLPGSGAAVNRRSTFICTREHTAAAGNEPPGNAWTPYRAPISSVATFHGPRLFIRDGDAGTGIVRYSEAITGAGLWDQTAWDSTDVQGAGFIPIRSGDGDDVQALVSMAGKLIICKRFSTWSLSGMNPSTWRLDRIGDVGAIFKRAAVEHAGLVYFLSDEGLKVTDGVEVQDAPNGNLVKDWLRDNIDVETVSGTKAYKVHVVTYKGFLWFALPGGDQVSRPNYTVVYDPTTASWWKTDIPAWMMAKAQVARVQRLFFGKIGAPALVMRYEPTTHPDEDDTGVTTQAWTPITWKARTAWLTFSSRKEQRRVRRVWTTIMGSTKNITLKLYRNFVESAIWTVTRTTSGDPVNYVEGKSWRGGDPYSISMEISGDSAPAAVVAANVETQFRRNRWNRGSRS